MSLRVTDPSPVIWPETGLWFMSKSKEPNPTSSLTETPEKTYTLAEESILEMVPVLAKVVLDRAVIAEVEE